MRYDYLLSLQVLSDTTRTMRRQPSIGRRSVLRAAGGIALTRRALGHFASGAAKLAAGGLGVTA